MRQEHLFDLWFAFKAIKDLNKADVRKTQIKEDVAKAALEAQVAALTAKIAKLEGKNG